MWQNKRKRLMLAALVLMLCIPVFGQAAGIQSGTPALTVNSRQVAFGGYKWWVVGDGTSGVYPQNGHITLLAIDGPQEFRIAEFRNWATKAQDNFTGYSTLDGKTVYYADNPDGTKWTTPNEYAGSNLQQKMEEIADGFPAKEQAVITARTLRGGGEVDNPGIDGIVGLDVADQKLWSLSLEEWETINNKDVRYYPNGYWYLRTPCRNDKIIFPGNPYGFPDTGVLWALTTGNDYSWSTIIMGGGQLTRPAFSLDLSSVFFTSVANQNGKSQATPGGNLVRANKTNENARVKFTMKDSSQTLTVNATEAQSTQTGATLSFSYSGATTGANQYVSCALTDQSNAVKYYGKLADSSGVASGTLSVPLAGVADGTYTLKIFSEEANEDLHTDFCSEPVTMTVTVASGSGTVSNFGGMISHEHSWSEKWSSDEDSHWHACNGCNEKKDVQAHQYKDGVCIVCGVADPVHHEHDINVLSGGHGTAHASCTTEEAGVWVQLSAEAEEGYHLERWEIVSGNVEIKGNAFLMPDEDVMVRAIFAPDTVAAVPPKTGDASHIGLWSALMLIGLCGMAALVIGRRSGHAGKR